MVTVSRTASERFGGPDFGATDILVAEVFGGGGGAFFFDLGVGSEKGSEEVRNREWGCCRDD
jgi:hypothetical protein